jgi:rhamnosyltransferase
LLTATENQRYDGDVDILVIDSGSTDATLDIVAKHPTVRLHTIPNSEFGHGKTRNLAAELATGEIVVYLTHDAVPAHDRWLAELLEPFADDERNAAVLGKQVARKDAPPIVKYETRRVFESLGPDNAMTVVYDTGRPMSKSDHDVVTFYSDANSAARRSVLTGLVPYRDVAYAEDQLLGRDLFDSGLRRVYSPLATVEHSNDTTLRTFGARIAADVIGMRQAGTELAPLSRVTAIEQFIKWAGVDSALILVDDDYAFGEKLYWLLVNPWYHVAKWRAYRRATLARL